MNTETTEVQNRQAAQDLPVTQPCQIFLVEDDMDDRILARREFSQCSYVGGVQTFSDGKELLDYMYEHGFMDHSVMLYKPILIVVDIEMPRKDGLAVIKELRADPFLQSIPLIVITGTESRQKILAARELGASGVFKKPLSRFMLNEYFQDAWQWPPQEMWR